MKVCIWVDGCFDMMHYGHANLLRQAKELGHELIVGVHSDKDIEINKGPPVMSEEERYKAVMSCKWVDSVVQNAPYFTSLEIMDKYNCNFCVHGDDITTMQDGTDCYQAVKDVNRYMECKRTIGISTTDLVDRMLHPDKPLVIDANIELDMKEKLDIFSNHSHPKSTDRIIYVSGDFDLLNMDHIDFLEKAKSFGDYLIVGIHSNEDTFKMTGEKVIMTQLERTLGVLSFKYVDDVIMDAPIVITDEFINKFKIDKVVSAWPNSSNTSTVTFHILPEFQNKLTNHSILNRIKLHNKLFEERNQRKSAKSKLEKEMKEVN